MTPPPIPEAFLTLGEEMHALGRQLFPICRSITGDGVRETLARIKGHVSGLEMQSFRSGETVGDWTIPTEWRMRGAHVIGLVVAGDVVVSAHEQMPDLARVIQSRSRLDALVEMQIGFPVARLLAGTQNHTNFAFRHGS